MDITLHTYLYIYYRCCAQYIIYRSSSYQTILFECIEELLMIDIVTLTNLWGVVYTWLILLLSCTLIGQSSDGLLDARLILLLHTIYFTKTNTSTINGISLYITNTCNYIVVQYCWLHFYNIIMSAWWNLSVSAIG